MLGVAGGETLGKRTAMPKKGSFTRSSATTWARDKPVSNVFPSRTMRSCTSPCESASSSESELLLSMAVWVTLLLCLCACGSTCILKLNWCPRALDLTVPGNVRVSPSSSGRTAGAGSRRLASRT